jgi:2-methylcitrate dehydratase PrpD
MQTSGVVAPPVLHRPPTPDWLALLGRFAANLTYDDIPDAVRERARLVLRDSIGAIAAGAQEPEVKALVERLDRLAGADGPAALIGLHRRGPATTAALVNGLAGTMLEMDEGNQFARGHPAIHVVPAILAAARLKGTDGGRLLTALVLGYEIGARIGIASNLRVTMHPHGTWGTVGAAVAIAKLTGATAARMVEVINLASSLGLATSRRTMLEGGTVRNSYAGWSNQIGLVAWEMVAAGMAGEADGLSTVFGGVVADDWRPDEMVDALGERWEIARNYFKMHACCRYNHGAIDALAGLMTRHRAELRPERIARVDVATYVWAAQLASREPHNMLAAKFSLPFSLATVIVNGAATIEAFRDKARANPVTRDLALRVTVVEDPALTARLPAERPARVTVTLTDGRTLTAEAATNRGDTEDPYAPDEIAAKFTALATPIWGAERTRRISRACMALIPGMTLDPLLDDLAG